jgi:hypothetical protein
VGVAVEKLAAHVRPRGDANVIVAAARSSSTSARRARCTASVERAAAALLRTTARSESRAFVPVALLGCPGELDHVERRRRVALVLAGLDEVRGASRAWWPSVGPHPARRCSCCV